ncbi:hypothetical protein ACVQMG_003133 [Enterobacter roggenkampii]
MAEQEEASRNEKGIRYIADQNAGTIVGRVRQRRHPALTHQKRQVRPVISAKLSSRSIIGLFFTSSGNTV